jgi:hypothetical protein
MNDKKHLYSIKWTQPYPQYDYNDAVDVLTELLVETYLEQGWYDEANAELTRIMKL